MKEGSYCYEPRNAAGRELSLHPVQPAPWRAPTDRGPSGGEGCSGLGFVPKVLIFEFILKPFCKSDFKQDGGSQTRAPPDASGGAGQGSPDPQGPHSSRSPSRLPRAAGARGPPGCRDPQGAAPSLASPALSAVRGLGRHRCRRARPGSLPAISL